MLTSLILITLAGFASILGFPKTAKWALFGSAGFMLVNLAVLAVGSVVFG